MPERGRLQRTDGSLSLSFLQKDIEIFCRMENCYYFCNRDGMNSEMPTLCNKFNFKSVIMKAILLENGIYIGVDTNVDKSLDDSKIQESKELVCCNVYSSGEAILFGGRVGVRYRSSCDWNLSVDGIKIKVLGYNTDYPYFANSFQNVVANLNQMQQLGVDTFLANYKLSLEKTKDELTVICDKLEGELSVQENEGKAKLLAKLRGVIIEMIVILFALMVDVNVGLDNHNYVDAYNEIVNEYSVD